MKKNRIFAIVALLAVIVSSVVVFQACKKNEPLHYTNNFIDDDSPMYAVHKTKTNINPNSTTIYPVIDSLKSIPEYREKYDFSRIKNEWCDSINDRVFTIPSIDWEFESLMIVGGNKLRGIFIITYPFDYNFDYYYENDIPLDIELYTVDEIFVLSCYIDLRSNSVMIYDYNPEFVDGKFMFLGLTGPQILCSVMMSYWSYVMVSAVSYFAGPISGGATIALYAGLSILSAAACNDIE